MSQAVINFATTRHDSVGQNTSLIGLKCLESRSLGCVFSHAAFSTAVLSGAVSSGAMFSGATFCGAVCFRSALSGSAFRGCRFLSSVFR